MNLLVAHLRKLKLLFWKQFIFMKGQKLLISVEILSPLLLFCIYFFLEHYIKDYLINKSYSILFKSGDTLQMYRAHEIIHGPETNPVTTSELHYSNYEELEMLMNKDYNIIAIYFWDNKSSANYEGESSIHNTSGNYTLEISNTGGDEYAPSTLLVASFFKISYAFLIFLVKQILDERISGMHSMIVICGIPEYLLWIDYFFAALSKCALTTAIVAFILAGSYSCPWTLMWMFLLLILVNGILMAFMCSLITDSALVNILAFSLLWFITYDVNETTTTSQKVQVATSCIHPGLALFQGLNAISNAYGKPNAKFSIDMSVVFTMLFLDVCWLTFLTAFLVFNRNRRNNLTVHFHPYLLLQPQVIGGVTSEEVQARKRNYQPVDVSTPISISLRNLRKVYTFGFENTVAVIDGISLDIYSNRTTILLGENAAGKTTLFSMILNLLKPTSGTVHGEGPFGYCPQENIFYSSVPIIQQLIIFGVLKGLTREEAGNDAIELIKELKLVKYANSYPKNISGNIRRKLSIALAIVGRPNIILLDEPTRGLNPSVKKDIWNMLLKLNGTRTILLSTHYMLEAEMLGDRIAILDCGVVQCYGTPKFLKKLYGTGYTLKVVKSVDGDTQMIAIAIKNIIRGADLKSEFGNTLTFALPYDEIDNFPNLFDELEANQDLLGIAGIKVTRSTLEEVFLKVLDTEMNELHLPGDWPCESRLPRGKRLDFQRFSALLKKKLLYMSYNWKPFLAVILFFMFFYLVLLRLVTKSKNTDFQSASFNYTEIPETSQRVFALTSGAYRQQPSSEKWIIDYVLHAKLQLENESQISVHVNIIPSMNDTRDNGLPSFRKLTQRFNYGKSLPLTMFSSNNAEKRLIMYSGQAWWFIVLPLMFAFVTPLALLLPLYERQNGFRHQLTLSGMSSFLYWTSNFVGDTLLSIFFSLYIASVMQLYDKHQTDQDFITIFFMLMIYSSFSCILAYLISYIVRSTVDAIVIILIISFIFISVPLIYQVQENIMERGSHENIVNFLRKLVSLVPQFVFKKLDSNTTVDISNNCRNLSQSYAELNCSHESNGVEFMCAQVLCHSGFFDVDSSKRLIVISQRMHETSIILYFLFLLIFTTLFMINFCLSQNRRERMRNPIITGTDVLNENSMVNRVLKKYDNVTQQYDVIALRLQKKLKNIEVVKGVTFGVAPNECFGLLGANYSGKSMVMRIIAGLETSYGGEAFVYKYNIRDDKANYLRSISYHPGSCGLNEALTGLETLQLVADILGIRREARRSYILFFIQLLNLEYDAHSTVSMYNRGTRCKLSFAIVLMSGVSVILLQDLTTEVDVITRKLLWLIVLHLQKKGRTVILSGHDSSECEKLCHRIGIMQNGQLTHIGSTPYLKHRYGRGYKIICKLRQVDGMTDARRELKKDVERFMDVHLVDDHPGLLYYRVVDPAIKWSDMFTILQTLKSTHKVMAEYSLSECSLGDIYMSLQEMRVSKRANMQQLVMLREKLNKGKKASLTSLV